MQADVYAIICFSEMSLPIADIFPNFILLTPPHERSADPIPRIIEFTLQAKKPRTLLDGKDYF